MRTILHQIEVAPLTILPLKRSPFFTYFSRQPIPHGSLVRIPFGKQILKGIVFSSAPLPARPASWIKEIESVIVPAYLTPQQLALAQSISDLYFTSLGRTLIHFVPDPDLHPEPQTISPSKDTPRHRFRTALKKTLAPLTQPGRHALSVVPEDRYEALALLIQSRQSRQTKKKQRSLALIVPEIIGAELLAAALERFGIEHRLLTSALTNKHFAAAWEYARTPGAVIIGTRQALFAPFFDLGTLILVDPIDDAYKQWDMSPRYDGRRIASLLAQAFQADLITFAPFLNITDIKEKSEEQLTHTDLVTVSALAPIEVVNLRLERYRKNYSPLSETARTRISQALARQEKIALIVNQSGYSKITRCEKCKHIFRCAHCQAPLHPEKSGSYICTACMLRTPLFPSCPHCGQIGFRQVGFGTERVEREVHKLFTYARIQRIDRSALETKHDRSFLTQTDFFENTDIFIGVPSLLNHLTHPSITTIIFVDVDTFLSFSDFRTDERFFERIFRSRLLAGNHGRVLLETFQPESAFFQKLSQKSYEPLLRSLLDDRAALVYPPFAALAAIEVLRDSPTLANTGAEKLGQAIQTLPESEKWRIFIQQAPERRFRGKYIARVLVRVKGDHFPKVLEQWLRSLPKDTFVDRDPLSLHV